MSKKIIQLNEEIIKVRSRNLCEAAWRKRSTNCWKRRQRS